MWRLITAQVATLQELETWWSLDDIYRANAVLDLQGAIEQALMPKLPKGKG